MEAASLVMSLSLVVTDAAPFKSFLPACSISFSYLFSIKRDLFSAGRLYLAPIPSLISPVIFPTTSAAPPIIFLATSPVLFNNEPPAFRFFPTKLL